MYKDLIFNLDSESLYKIGRYYVFDTNTCKGYKVIRNTSGSVVGFQMVFEIRLENGEIYRAETYEEVPAGIVRKAINLISSR